VHRKGNNLLLRGRGIETIPLRIKYHTVSPQAKPGIFPTPVCSGNIALVFNCTCPQKGLPMVDARSWPGSGNKEYVNILSFKQCIRKQGKTEVIAGVKPQGRIPDFGISHGIPRGKNILFRGEKMNFAVSRSDMVFVYFVHSVIPKPRFSKFHGSEKQGAITISQYILQGLEIGERGIHDILSTGHIIPDITEFRKKKDVQ
jgi:hypothetical protein